MDMVYCSMPRKAAEFWWNLKRSEENRFVPPKEVCRYDKMSAGDKWVPVTWKEIHALRTEKQRANEGRKRRGYHIKPCYIWVFYNDTNFFGGWYIYIKTLKKDYALNFRTGHKEKELLSKIMQMIPCGVLPFDFETWAIAFEKEFRRKAFGREVQGLKKCFCLIDPYGDISDVLL